MFTEKNKRFVVEYIIDLHAGHAAIRAGYSKNSKSAATLGSRLTAEPEIAAAIAEVLEQRSVRMQLTADSVLEELAKLGYANRLGNGNEASGDTNSDPIARHSFTGCRAFCCPTSLFQERSQVRQPALDVTDAV
jgi:phage terminase small subunit